MKSDFFYNNYLGRMLIKILWRLGVFKLAAWFLRTRASKILISSYIRNNSIDMTSFEGQTYNSFAEFFARKKYNTQYVVNPNVLISPCDGNLSIYDITSELEIPMKGSHYSIGDLISDYNTSKNFRNGMCFIFRLEASDYHHFYSFDDLYCTETHFIPGKLHSVQPIACKSVPVYRLNRRWWTLLKTLHFRMVAQIEVGAMLVGGVSRTKESEWLYRGSEMGNFELAGSTIILLFDSRVKEQLMIYPEFKCAYDGDSEIRVNMGEGIGELRDEEY